MDPNETLRRLREQVSKARADIEAQGYANLADVQDVLMHFFALDEWLSKGGFPPNAWVEPMKRAVQAMEQMGVHLIDSPRVVVEPLGPPNPAGAELPDPVTGRGFVELSDGTTSIVGSPAHLADQETSPGHYEQAVDDA